MTWSQTGERVGEAFLSKGVEGTYCRFLPQVANKINESMRIQTYFDKL